MPADEDQSRATMQQLVAAAVLEQLTPVQKALADLRADVAGLQSQQKQATAHAVHAASTGASQRPGIPRARPRQDRWPSGKQPHADSAGLSQAEKHSHCAPPSRLQALTPPVYSCLWLFLWVICTYVRACACAVGGSPRTVGATEERTRLEALEDKLAAERLVTNEHLDSLQRQLQAALASQPQGQLQGASVSNAGGSEGAAAERLAALERVVEEDRAACAARLDGFEEAAALLERGLHAALAQVRSMHCANR